jgi:uncharacterized protein (TIGR02246 family)
MTFARHSRVTVTAAVAAALVACQPQDRQRADGAAIDTAAILASLDSLAAAVAKADNSGDADQFGATWAEDGIMSVPGSPLVRGRDAIVSAFRNRPPLPPGGTMKITPLEIRVLSADWAYAFGVDTLTYTPPGATEPKKETSTFLVLIRKTPEGWKTYREVLAANQSPGAPSK